MATRERYSNPVVNDNVILRLFTYNANNLSNVHSVLSIDIYHLDENNKSCDNEDGRCLLETIDGSLITNPCEGQIYIDLFLESPKYQIGKYLDVWNVVIDPADEPVSIANYFQVYPNLWYTTPIPVVYDFNFRFQPNKLRQGSKQFLIIEITPNVPKATDLQRYYENLAIYADLKVSIETSSCSGCADLELLVDNEPVSYREKKFGYYQLDTTDMDCGIYNIWFRLDVGCNTYISDKMQFQIYN